MPSRSGPQSNQRGIETQTLPPDPAYPPPPQSNQRGIETLFGIVLFILQAGLNRTSVGLKQDPEPDRAPETVSGLNRTSVGLKLMKKTASKFILKRLNRTSVGLKPWRKRRVSLRQAAPQSNQRGIETCLIASCSQFR